ncbi:hypothetical protein AMECASPLE_032765 [Ameca splendens]|uniref:Uncharacterized protein n=1 Tax=Ameca splendens TaxID=208324 RepID=A0ABV0XVL6_9TELE
MCALSPKHAESREGVTILTLFLLHCTPGEELPVEFLCAENPASLLWDSQCRSCHKSPHRRTVRNLANVSEQRQCPLSYHLKQDKEGDQRIGVKPWCPTPDKTTTATIEPLSQPSKPDLCSVFILTPGFICSATGSRQRYSQMAGH